MIFTSLKPAEDKPGVWAVQQRLLAEAQNALGERDATKPIWQPRFATDGKGPRLMTWDSPEGALAMLSANAAGFWPALVFELAHETVHLLNPMTGYTTLLEEGIAVAFSLRALDLYEVPRFDIEMPVYRDALTVAEALPGGPFEFGRTIRSRFGSLHGFNAVDLHEAFPAIELELAARLSETCVSWLV